MVLFGVVVFIPLIVTLYNLMIRDHDYYEAQAIDNQTRYTSLSASRGQIFDRNMNVLASSKTVETVFIDPNEIAQEMTKPENSNLLDHIARGLSEILDVSTDFVYKQAEDKAFRYKVIRRKIPEELADEVRSFVSENEIKGVYLETDAQRYYPYSSLAAQVMGFVSTDNVGSEDSRHIMTRTCRAPPARSSRPRATTARRCSIHMKNTTMPPTETALSRRLTRRCSIIWKKISRQRSKI